MLIFRLKGTEMAIGFSQTFGIELKVFSAAMRTFSAEGKLSRAELMQKIGVGDNRAEAVVTWLGKLGLRDNKERCLTPLGKFLIEKDAYLKNITTQWILYYQLAKNPDAEVWYYLSNRFITSRREFTSKDAMQSLELAGVGQNSPRHLKSDVHIFLQALTDSKALKELNLLEKIGTDRYKIKNCKGIHPFLVGYILFDQKQTLYPNVSTINIKELLTADGNVGKVCLLSRDKLEDFFKQLQQMGYIAISKFADLDQIAFKFEGHAIQILKGCYE